MRYGTSSTLAVEHLLTLHVSDLNMYADGPPFLDSLRVVGTRTTLFFLVQSHVAYINKTDDLWFSATKTIPNFQWYISDEPATVLAYTEKRTSCNSKLPASEGCRELFSSSEAEFKEAWPDPQDRMSLRPISVVLQQYGAGGMQAYFQAKSVPSLLSRQTLFPWQGSSDYTTIQTKALPSNQWQKEMEYIGQATFAAMQHFLVDYARGSWFGGQGLCESEPCRRTCYSQVRKPPELQGHDD